MFQLSLHPVFVFLESVTIVHLLSYLFSYFSFPPLLKKRKKWTHLTFHVGVISLFLLMNDNWQVRMLFIPNRACVRTESCSRTILVMYATRNLSLSGVHTYMALHSIGCIRISCLFNHIKGIRLIKPCLIREVEENWDYSLVPEQRTGCLSPDAPFRTVICTESFLLFFLIIKMSHTGCVFYTSYNVHR